MSQWDLRGTSPALLPLEQPSEVSEGIDRLLPGSLAIGESPRNRSPPHRGAVVPVYGRGPKQFTLRAPASAIPWRIPTVF